MTQKQKDKQEAISHLLEILKPGDTVRCVLRHRSASGMSRDISFFAPDADYGIRDITYLVGRALDYRQNDRNNGLRVNGCGMDMGFSVVYNLGATLWPSGFDCAGRNVAAPFGCPSNDHSNGDRDYTPHAHKDGGYALRSVWL